MGRVFIECEFWNGDKCKILGAAPKVCSGCMAFARKHERPAKAEEQGV